MKKKKMSTKLKYFLGLLISIPLLPFLYFQGKSIRKKTPVLPEAAVPTGFVDGQFKSTLSLLTIGESTIAGVGVKEYKGGGLQAHWHKPSQRHFNRI
jgi:hypothetical protein